LWIDLTATIIGAAAAIPLWKYLSNNSTNQ
jgi:hypothetical protein